MNTSMLGMGASRITVDSQDGNESYEEEEASDQEEAEQAASQSVQETPAKPGKEDSGDEETSPEWKYTPLKALEMLNSIRSSLSRSKSLSNDDNKQDEAEQNADTKSNGKAEMDDDEEDEQAAQEEDDDNDVVKEMDVTPTGNEAEQQQDTTASSETVENLFYVSPSPIIKAKTQTAISGGSNVANTRSVVQPKSELKKKEKSASISMTFGDGQKFEFKSVYSPSASAGVSKSENQSKARLSTENNNKTVQRSITPEVFSEKTMAIRQMMDEVEREYEGNSPLQLASNSNNKTSISMLEDKEKTNSNTDQLQSKRRKSMSAAGSALSKKKKGGVPDWNAIHQKQIFSRQPDLRQWDEAKKARAAKLFGEAKQVDELTGTKMSTPGVRQRSKSMAGSKPANHTHNSEKKPSQKRVTIVPSSNDHKFNQGADARLNRQIQRAPTPYKHNLFHEETERSNMRNVKKKASAMPLFNAAFTEDTIIESDVNEEDNKNEADSVNVEGSESVNNSSNDSSERAVKIPKKKLAFDPEKVKSKLYQSTSSSSNKMKARKSSQTPQVKSMSRDKILVNRSKMANKKNWSAVKSKVDTGLFRLPGKKAIDEESMESGEVNEAVMAGEQQLPTAVMPGRVSGIKRKLSWSVSSKSNSSEARDCDHEPASKKRRMSQLTPSSSKRWQ